MIIYSRKSLEEKKSSGPTIITRGEMARGKKEWMVLGGWWEAPPPTACDPGGVVMYAAPRGGFSSAAGHIRSA